MSMKKLLVVMAFAFFFPQAAFAATFVLSPTLSTIGVGESFDVLVSIDGEGEDLNAVEGNLVYDPSVLRLEAIDTSQSALTLWVENPSVSTSQMAGDVSFSGITPGGFGSVLIPRTDGIPQGMVFKARFVVLAVGDPALTMKNASALLNDGLGTATNVSVTQVGFTIRELPTGNGAPSLIDDAVLPQDFTLQIVRDVQLLEGKWVVVFQTSDKESGIDHYEVQENGGAWMSAVSPYVLKDQDGQTVVKVRAIDHAGNVREVGIDTRSWIVQNGLWCILGAILLSVAIVVIARRVIWRNNKKGR